MSSMTKEEAATMIETMISWYAFNGREVEALGMGVDALRPVGRERIEKVWRGEWVKCKHADYYVCNKCSTVSKTGEDEFCKSCGAPMTGEAVEVTMKRLEELYAADIE